MKWTERPWSIVVLVRVGVDGAFSNLVLVVFDVFGGTCSTGGLFRALFFIILYTKLRVL
jgi:hypothetical protein